MTGDQVSEPTGQQVDAADFRAALRNFASGVTVVTCRVDGIDHAMTASAFTAVSKEPPLVLVCVSRAARFNAAIRSADQWAVSVLSGSGEEASRWLATSGRPLIGQLDRVPHTRGDAGVALLSDSLVHLECRTREIAPGGDHDIIIGLVERVHPRPPAPPLIYWQGDYRALAPTSGNRSP